ncbi:MAG: hypothetical protein ACI8RZ_006467 [Myxococcota bacterium]|jgi:hypothetical protein
MMLWLALACVSQPEPLPERIEDCLDAACREVWILHPDHRDAAVQVAALQTITQPEERIVLVRKILDLNPQQPQTLCQQLPDGDARQYCARIQHRPHLTEAPPRRSEQTARASGGPSNTEPGGLSGGGFVEGLTPQEAGCVDVSDERACRSQDALIQATSGDLGAAARSCLAVEAGRWRGECMFSAAETGLASGAPYARTAQLCMAAEPFSQQCHSHLLSAMAIRVPGASSPAIAWKRTINHAEQIAAAWAKIDPGIGALLVDRFWSEAVRLSYLEQPVVGDPLDHLPPGAAPHVRAAVAWNLVAAAPSAEVSLATWVSRAEAALASRAEAATTPLTPRVRKTMRLWIRDHWETDSPGDGAIPATYYFGSARRPLDADPAIDLQLCLLEALARQPGASTSLFETAAISEVAVIAWSARRLKRTLSQQHKASQHR